MTVMMGLVDPVTRWVRQDSKAMLAVVMVFSMFLLTAFALAGEALMLVTHGSFLVKSGTLDAFAWLDAHSKARDLVFADADIANQIPRYAHNSVFYGYYNAVHTDEKYRDLTHFLDSDSTPEFRRDLIRRCGARFVLLTTDEDAQLSGIRDAPFLRESLRNDAVVIYTVIDSFPGGS